VPGVDFLSSVSRRSVAETDPDIERDEAEWDGIAPAPRSTRASRLESPGNGLRRVAQRVGERLAVQRGLRVDPGRRPAMAVGLAALLAVLIAGAWVLVQRPHASALTTTTSTPQGPQQSLVAAGPSTLTTPSTPTTGPTMKSAIASAVTIVVDVVGKVARPGIYQLTTGARVDDALRAAGGALPGVDVSSLNLARLVGDGEQIAVGVTGAADSGAVPTGTPNAAAPVGRVNLNTATVAQLDALPGVGPVLAQHIVTWRSEHGRFTSIDQVREVSGIADAKFDDLRALVVL
jgi:competence protein ComEA